MGSSKTRKNVEAKIQQEEKNQVIRRLNRASHAVKMIGIRGQALKESLDHILAETTTAQNHPLNEAIRNMGNPFKMYCLVYADPQEQMEKDLVGLSMGEVTEEALERIRVQKTNFLQMVLNKDMDAIADYYVRIAEYAESKISTLADCEDLGRLPSKSLDIFLLQGAMSYLNQTLSLSESGNGISEDRKQLIAEVNKRLKDRGKDYTLGEVEDTLAPFTALSDFPLYREGFFTRENYTAEELENNKFEPQKPGDLTGDVAALLLNLPRMIREQRTAAIDQGKDPDHFFVNIDNTKKIENVDKTIALEEFEDEVTEIHNKKTDPNVIPENLTSSQIYGLFGRKNNPPQYEELIQAVDEALSEKERVESRRAKGEKISFSEIENYKNLFQKVKDKASLYLSEFEPGSGASAERYRLVIFTHEMAKNSLQKIKANPDNRSLAEAEQRAKDFVAEAAEVRKLNHNLDKALREVITESFSIDDEQMKKISGMPFYEFREHMESFFKMYCLTKGLTEDSLEQMAQTGTASDGLKAQFGEWKQDFLKMVLDKDLEKISDMYVNLAGQIEADRDRFARLIPDDPNAIKENQALILKYADADIWYNRTFARYGKWETTESRQVITLVDEKIRKMGKNYTYDHLRLPLQAIESIAQEKVESWKINKEKNDAENMDYDHMHAYEAILQDHLHSPKAHEQGRSWLEAMPDLDEVVNIGKEASLKKTQEEKYAEQRYYETLSEIVPISLELDQAEKEKNFEVKMNRLKGEIRKNDYYDQKVGTKHENSKVNKSINLDKKDIIPENPYENKEHFDDIEEVLGDQTTYRSIFEKANVPYSEEAIWKILQDKKLVALHEKAKETLRKNEEIKERLNQYRGSDSRLSRITYLFMNSDDTPEAKQENEKRLAEISTPEGARALIHRIALTILDTDPKEFTVSSTEEMTEKYLADPWKYNLLFGAIDISSGEGGLNFLDEPLRSAVAEKIPVLQVAGSFMQAAQIMAADEWAAYIQPELTADQLETLGATIEMMIPNLTKIEDEKKTELSVIASNLCAEGIDSRERKYIAEMEKRGLRQDHQTLYLSGKKITRNQALQELVKDPLKIEDLTAIPNTPEEIESFEKAKEELPVTVDDVKGIDLCKGILNYHRRTYEKAGYELPSAFELNERMKKDPEGQKLHERAKAFYQSYNNRLLEVINQFPSDTIVGLDRVYFYMLDLSDTPEAVEYNKQLTDSITTLEGQKRMVNYIVKQLMDQPDDFFLAKNIQEAASRYMENPQVFNLGFAAHELIAKQDGAGSIDQFLDEPLLDAFKAKVSFLQSGGVFKTSTSIMARDDWAMFTPLVEDQNKALSLAGMYGKKEIQNDPYKQDEKDNPVTLLGAVGEPLRENFLLYKLPEEQKHRFFSNGAEISMDGKISGPNQNVIDRLLEKGPESVRVENNKEKQNEITKQLKELDTDYMKNVQAVDMIDRSDNRIVATAGNALRRDMTELYHRLDEVNHGAFISTAKFDHVLKTVYDLAHNYHTPQQVEDTLERLLNYATIYVDGKSERANRHALKGIEQKRYDVVYAIKVDCAGRLKTISNRHKTAEAIHDSFHAKYSSENAEIKPVEQLYDEETARMPVVTNDDLDMRRAREIAAKYRATPQQIAEIEEDGATFVPTLPETAILRNVQNTKLQTVHEAAIRASKINAFYNDLPSEEKEICGNADPSMNRISRYFMDSSNTPEAEERNRLLHAAMSTPEGCKALYSKMVHRLLTSDTLKRMLTASTMGELLAYYLDDPQICELAYMTKEIENFTNQLEEPLKTAYKDRINALQIANTATVAINYMASDAFLAYPEMKISQEYAEKWSALSATLTEISPTEQMMEKKIVFLGLDLGTAEVFKKLGKKDKDEKVKGEKDKDEKDLLGGKFRFLDEDGEHLDLFSAADRMAKNKKVMVKELSEEEKMAFDRELAELDVADPLDIGRNVLNGKQKGVSGTATKESYHEKLKELEQQLEQVREKAEKLETAKADAQDAKPENAKLSKEGWDTLKEIADLLKEANEKDPQDLMTMSELHHDLNEKLEEIYKKVSNKSDIESSLRTTIWNLCNETRNASNLFHTASLHQDYAKQMEKECDNGLSTFIARCLSPDSPGPQTLKDLALKGLRMIESCEDMVFEKISAEKRQIMAQGLSAAILLNRIGMEEKSGESRKPGSVSDIFVKNPEPAESVCRQLSSSTSILEQCHWMCNDRQIMHSALASDNSARSMDKLLMEIASNNSVEELVEKSVEDAKEAAAEKAFEEQAENEAFAQYYRKPAHDVYVNEQKDLAAMLRDPLKYAKYDNIRGDETRKMARQRTYMGNLRRCLANMIAAKQIYDFARDHAETLGDEGIISLCSMENILDRADRIVASDTMISMTGALSPLLKKNALCNLAIGAEDLMEYNATISEGPVEHSDHALNALVKKYESLEKNVKPVSLEDVPNLQQKWIQPSLDNPVQI